MNNLKSVNIVIIEHHGIEVTTVGSFIEKI